MAQEAPGPKPGRSTAGESTPPKTAASEPPATRLLRVFAFDPSLSTEMANYEVSEVLTRIPWERDRCWEGQGGTLGQTVASSGADFVIAGADYDFAEVARVLDERPRLRVLAVAGHGREAFLYELRPTRTPLGEVSPRAIVEAIRSARYATS